jgi:hypothetical protein
MKQSKSLSGERAHEPDSLDRTRLIRNAAALIALIGERSESRNSHGCATFQWFHTVKAMMMPKPT